MFIGGDNLCDGDVGKTYGIDKQVHEGYNVQVVYSGYGNGFPSVTKRGLIPLW